MQDDLLFGFLTVKETLILASHFSFGPHATEADKNVLVKEIITVSID